jgi:hypothetical protein
MYYGLNAVGGRVWELIQEPRNVSDVRDLLLAEYEVGADECLQEVLRLLQDLAVHQLVEVDNGAPPEAGSGDR